MKTIFGICEDPDCGQSNVLWLVRILVGGHAVIRALCWFCARKANRTVEALAKKAAAERKGSGKVRPRHR